MQANIWLLTVYFNVAILPLFKVLVTANENSVPQIDPGFKVSLKASASHVGIRC